MKPALKFFPVTSVEWTMVSPACGSGCWRATTRAGR